MILIKLQPELAIGKNLPRRVLNPCTPHVTSEIDEVGHKMLTKTTLKS